MRFDLNSIGFYGPQTSCSNITWCKITYKQCMHELAMDDLQTEYERISTEKKYCKEFKYEIVEYI